MNKRSRDLYEIPSIYNKIQHDTIFTNGIKLHVASIGTTGPAILFLHGFPELWYSWRHQLLYFSALGFRAFAPDLRGYGDSHSPVCSYLYTSFHIIGDLIGLLDHFSLDQVFLVGHDWGALIAWSFALYRPDRIKALVALSVPFSPRDPAINPIDFLRNHFGDDFYVCRFLEVGGIEEEFDDLVTSDILRIFFSIHKPEPPFIPKETGLRGLIVPESLPSWLSEDDITYYANQFCRTGLYGGLNYYRAMKLNWELTAPWTGSKVKVPAKYIVGKLDVIYHIPGVIEYLHKGGFKRDVPKLEQVVEIEGAGHFLNQERAEEINKHIHDFIIKYY